jgi:hypothetical protein
MRNQQPREETGRVLALAAGLWGSVVAVAALEGAFARFDGDTLTTLAAFVSLFAVATVFLDQQVRDYARRLEGRAVATATLVLATAFVVALALRSAPFAMFFAPLAALAGAAAFARGGPRRSPKSAAPAKSPGVNPAAT